MTGPLPASTRPASSPDIIQASLISLAQQPPPTHTSPCKPSRRRSGRLWPPGAQGEHHLCTQVNHPPTEAPAALLDPRNQPPPHLRIPARPTLRWRRPERSPRDAWRWEAGGRKLGGAEFRRALIWAAAFTPRRCRVCREAGAVRSARNTGKPSRPPAIPHLTGRGRCASVARTARRARSGKDARREERDPGSRGSDPDSRG